MCLLRDFALILPLLFELRCVPTLDLHFLLSIPVFISEARIFGFVREHGFSCFRYGKIEQV